MGFYEQISKYYDYIFPVGKAQIEFIRNSAGLPSRRILDVACGSGGYSVELAKIGYDMTAVDLDQKMVEMARDKAANEGVGINAFQCDMKELEKVNQRDGYLFDLIFCIGNSIVHLGSIKEIGAVLKQMHSLLYESGTLVLQIINYDRIIGQGLSELPTIRNDEVGLEFIRKYEYNENRGTISFNTVLSINGKDIKEKYENSIELLPVTSADMKKAVEEAGFKDIKLYGDFGYTPYEDNSYMLVIEAKN